MQAPIRKRVTRVGSGAYSIYLPKKWIDSWTPAQQEGREVDLHAINEALLVVPAIIENPIRATVEGADAVSFLRSAYVRGYSDVALAPADGSFDNNTLGATRDLLRHLDERIVGRFQPDEVGFTIDRDLPPPASTGDDILRVMSVRLQEVIRLAGEAVASYHKEPDRALDTMKLLRDTHEEDVSRLFHQALRLVANLELPIDTVSGLQLLDLVAADLLRVSSHAQHLALAILEGYGLRLEDLDYPRDHLLERVGPLQPASPLTRDLVRGFGPAFERAGLLVQETVAGIAEHDMAMLRSVEERALAGADDIQERIFSTIGTHWGRQGTRDEAQQVFVAYRLSTPVTNIHIGLANTVRHAVTMLAAAERRGGAP